MSHRIIFLKAKKKIFVRRGKCFMNVKLLSNNDTHVENVSLDKQEFFHFLLNFIYQFQLLPRATMEAVNWQLNAPHIECILQFSTKSNVFNKLC